MAENTPQSEAGLNRLISRKVGMAAVACYLIAGESVDFSRAILIASLSALVIVTQAVIDYHKTDHGISTEDSEEKSIDTAVPADKIGT